FLTLDSGGHGGLAIAEKGRDLARGQGTFRYRVEMRNRAARGKTRPDAAAGTEELDTALLAALKAVRLRLAWERQVPAFVIFSDRTLIDMAERCPRDLDAFAAVNGV
ncbi:MAG: ATP-dependent DNA helicase RecQ, partial [Mesorhizobium sp.]